MMKPKLWQWWETGNDEDAVYCWQWWEGTQKKETEHTRSWVRTQRRQNCKTNHKPNPKFTGFGFQFWQMAILKSWWHRWGVASHHEERKIKQGNIQPICAKTTKIDEITGFAVLGVDHWMAVLYVLLNVMELVSERTDLHFCCWIMAFHLFGKRGWN